MPVRFDHHSANRLNVIIRHTILKKIAHRVHKHELWGAPKERLCQFRGDQAKVESLLIRMPFDSAKPLRKRLGIAMLAAGTDLRAAANRIPGRVGPFDV